MKGLPLRRILASVAITGSVALSALGFGAASASAAPANPNAIIVVGEYGTFADCYTTGLISFGLFGPDWACPPTAAGTYFLVADVPL